MLQRLANPLAAGLQRHWWRASPSLLARSLQPLAWVVAAVAAFDRRRQARRGAGALDVPVVVVGNLIVGGAGKTPATLALIEHLQRRGWRPGVVSRGYGRRSRDQVDVGADTPAARCGDEPLLIHRRTGVPVVVGADRLAAAQALLRQHPQTNIIVADDGLQHTRLPRDVQIVVFDERGAGNGLTLPAGPLRQPLPAARQPRTLLLYNADAPSTALPGHLARRRMGGIWPLADWWAGRPAAPHALDALRRQCAHQPLLAAAGLGQPQRFFAMLQAAGLRIEPLALPDHAAFTPPPWPANAPAVLVSEKDATKIAPQTPPAGAIWVVGLDFRLPDSLTQALDDLLPPAPPPPSVPKDRP